MRVFQVRMGWSSGWTFRLRGWLGSNRRGRCRCGPWALRPAEVARFLSQGSVSSEQQTSSVEELPAWSQRGEACGFYLGDGLLEAFALEVR